MKTKLTTLLGAVALLCSCTEDIVEQLDTTQSNDTQRVTITASKNTKSESRIAIDASESTWDVAWSEGDKLGGFSDDTSTNTMYEFTESGISNDSSSADFTGDAPTSGNIRFFYPYTSEEIITDGLLSIDISEQSADISDTYNHYGMNHIYLISESVAAQEVQNSSIAMKHLVSALELTVSLSDADTYTGDELILEKVTIEGFKSSGEIDFEEETITTSEEEIITLNIVNNSTDIKDGTQKIPFSIFPTTIDSDTHANITLQFTSGAIAVVTKSGPTDGTLEFEAGKHNSLICNFSSEDVTTPLYDETGAVGSFDDPYIIKNSDDLRHLSTMVNSGTGYSGCYFSMTHDIDLEGVKDGLYYSSKKFTPIGTSTYPFQGTFDGCNNEILGLYVYLTTNTYNQGLFGNINGATIINLGVSGYVNGYTNVGGIVGYGEDSYISNCSNSATIVCRSYGGGGIVGSSINTDITYCHNEGDLTLINAISNNVGGIVGYSETTNISNCYNTASVNGVSYVGGIAGYTKTNSSIEESYNTGAITGEEYYCKYVGGIVGYSSATSLSECYNEAEVSNTGYNCETTGGIAGYAYNTSFIDCYNDTDATVTGYTHAGGISGYSKNCKIASCHNAAAITSVINNGSYIGGICGYQTASTSYENYIYYIKDSYNTGKISDGDYMGGVVAYASNITIISSYNEGEVSETDNTGYVGGVSGYTTASDIINCLNKGNISTSDSNNVGGIAGYTLSDSYLTLCFNVSGVTGGGVVGKVKYNAVVDCYWATDVDGAPSSGIYSGSNDYCDVTGNSEEFMNTLDFQAVIDAKIDTYNESHPDNPQIEKRIY